MLITSFDCDYTERDKDLEQQESYGSLAYGRKLPFRNLISGGGQTEVQVAVGALFFPNIRRRKIRPNAGCLRAK